MTEAQREPLTPDQIRVEITQLDFQLKRRDEEIKMARRTVGDTTSQTSIDRVTGLNQQKALLEAGKLAFRVALGEVSLADWYLDAVRIDGGFDNKVVGLTTLPGRPLYELHLEDSLDETSPSGEGTYRMRRRARYYDKLPGQEGVSQ